MTTKKKAVKKSLSLFPSARAGTRKRRPRRNLPRRKIRFWLLFVLNALLLLGGVIWYNFQPPERQEEVRFVCRNYFARNREISLFELAGDIWNLYYGGEFVECGYAPDDEMMVYGGLPVRTEPGQTAGLRILRNPGYLTGYDEIRRTPAWVAYRLFDLTLEPTINSRPDSFQVDERTIAKVRSEEYTGSGFDRGHLAPNYAIARCYGPEAQAATFLMSNIVPQRHALNAGLWKQLERREAINYPGRFQEIWLLTGPVFRDQPPRELPSGLPIPDAFFKILLDEQAGRIRILAFLIDQDAEAGRPLEEFLCSVDQIEVLTGLDFFPELPEAVQQQLESQVSRRCW